MEKTQEQKKDRKGLIVLVLLLVAVVSTTFAVTFSRYMTSAGASTSADVAKWSIKVGESGGTLKDITTEALSLEDCDWDNSKSTAADGTIAPGSVCTYELEIENDSEVDAVISVEAGDITDPNGALVQNSGITASVSGGGSVEVGKGNSETVTLTIEWEVGDDDVYATSTDEDTALGIDPTTLNVDVNVLAKQKIAS